MAQNIPTLIPQAFRRNMQERFLTKFFREVIKLISSPSSCWAAAQEGGVSGAFLKTETRKCYIPLKMSKNNVIMWRYKFEIGGRGMDHAALNSLIKSNLSWDFKMTPFLSIQYTCSQFCTVSHKNNHNQNFIETASTKTIDSKCYSNSYCIIF